jgi:hypothetical protein
VKLLLQVEWETPSLVTEQGAMSELGPSAAISGRRAHIRSYVKSRHRLAQYAAARRNVLCRRYVKSVS